MNTSTYTPIDGYPGYSINRQGDVLSTRQGGARILKTTLDAYKYKYVMLYLNGKGKKLKIHRLVALTHVTGYVEGLVVNHIDGDKHNNNAVNLEWTTVAGNTQHAIDNKLLVTLRGTEQVKSKLVDDDIRAIRSSSLTCVALSKLFKVSVGLISGIRLGKRWKHIK